VRGRTDAEFLDDRAQGEMIMANDRRVMSGGVPEVLEELVGNADGATRVWLSTKAPLYDAGKVIGLVGVSQDITERKLAEKRLVELNETLEERVTERTRERDGAWNNSQDMLAVLDGTGTLKTINAAWTTILGWTHAELIDRSCLDFIHPDDHPSTRAALVDAGAAPVMHLENRYRHKDGTYRWVSWVAASDGGKIYASARHISIEKEAAAALAAKAAQLEASNRELESFTYSVSHDLRAPLRAIDGFGMMLEEDYGARLDDEGRRLLSVMRDSSRRMGVLIDDLLKLSRLTGSRVERKSTDLSALAEQVCSVLRANNPSRNVLVRIKPGMIDNVDPGLMKIAFENLFDNAWKYTGKTENAVIVFGNQPDGTYYIQDNGAGFDMAHSTKLFGAFQRLHTQQEFRGNGVGLATVQRVINKHNGRIWAEAAVDHGASFYFTIGEDL